MTDRDRSRSRSPDRNGNDNHHRGDDYRGDNKDGSGETVKLYVGNLSYDTTPDSLREAFSVHGVVTDVFLPADKMSSRPRGFGFVSFSRRSDAEQAIKKMDQTELDGRTIRVNESKPRGENHADTSRSSGLGPGGRSSTFNASGSESVKLYVGNLHFDATEESVRNFFEQYGTVKDCFLPHDKENGKFRGFAFVTMSAAEAQIACEKSNGQELEGRTLQVNEAQPKGSSGPQGRGGGAGGYGHQGGYEAGGYGGRPQYDDYRGGRNYNDYSKGGGGGRPNYEDFNRGGGRGGYGGGQSGGYSGGHGGGYGGGQAGRGAYDDYNRGGYAGRGSYDDYNRAGYGGGYGGYNERGYSDHGYSGAGYADRGGYDNRY